MTTIEQKSRFQIPNQTAFAISWKLRKMQMKTIFRINIESEESKSETKTRNGKKKVKENAIRRSCYGKWKEIELKTTVVISPNSDLLYELCVIRSACILELATDLNIQSKQRCDILNVRPSETIKIMTSVDYHTNRWGTMIRTDREKPIKLHNGLRFNDKLSNTLNYIQIICECKSRANHLTTNRESLLINSNQMWRHCRK